MLPKTLFAGDSWQFDYKNLDYIDPAWELTLHIVRESTAVSSAPVASATGEFAFTLDTATTSGLAAAAYTVSITASNGTQRKTLLSDHKLDVKGDPTVSDNRSFNARMVDILEDLLAKRLTTRSPIFESMSIDGAQVSKMKAEDIEKALEKYKRLLAAEEAIKAKKEGLSKSPRSLIMVRR
jgi:hypothetical protein